MGYIYAILVFGLIIFIHELGHFIAAKLSGITVYEFNIGFGPPILKKKRGETLYAVRALPFGGAVVMKDINEDPPEGVDPADFTTKGSFQEASYLKKVFVSAAGAAMNMVTGILIIFMILLPAQSVAGRTLSGFAEGFPLTDTLYPGDTILKINDIHAYTYNDILIGLELGSGQPYDIEVLRDGSRVVFRIVDITPRDYDGTGQLRYGLNFTYEDVRGLRKVDYSFRTAMSFFQSAYKSIGMLFSGKAQPSELMGTIGIADTLSEKASESMADMWYFVAFISVNLAFMNMLPLPILDGGRIIISTIELIIRRPINSKIENYVSMVGMVFIIGLFVFVTYHDIVRLITG